MALLRPTLEEILGAVKKLKNYKAPGVDCISNEQLKHGGNSHVAYLHVLFSRVWEEETIPEDWSKGIITVIGKKGDKSQLTMLK